MLIGVAGQVEKARLPAVGAEAVPTVEAAVPARRVAVAEAPCIAAGARRRRRVRVFGLVPLSCPPATPLVAGHGAGAVPGPEAAAVEASPTKHVVLPLVPVEKAEVRLLLGRVRGVQARRVEEEVGVRSAAALQAVATEGTVPRVVPVRLLEETAAAAAAAAGATRSPLVPEGRPRLLNAL